MRDQSHCAYAHSEKNVVGILGIPLKWKNSENDFLQKLKENYHAFVLIPYSIIWALGDAQCVQQSHIHENPP